MCAAVLLDLLHGCGPGCRGASPREELARSAHVFVLCGARDRLPAAFVSSCGSVHALDAGSTAQRLFRFKQTLDQLDLSAVRVLTSPRGRAVLRAYQAQLFTALYTFEYRVDALTCPGCAGPAHSDSPVEAGLAEEDVSGFLQLLPALKGNIRVLTSPLIPDCFGHGFSTRAGGVSSIASLSSLNLFCSHKRRDAPAAVTENLRRLALHAGFHPQNLHLVKVDHGSHVWVVGGAEPERYDGVVTDRPGVVVAAPGADCMPILFADPVSKVIAAAHAGWKGTLMGVAMATVSVMMRDFGCRATDIVVAVGPAVGVCCFTLDQQRALRFRRLQQRCVPDPLATRPHVDIRLANRVLLQRGGVLPHNIHDAESSCTCCHPDDFFSHTRDGLNFGTQLGFLWIRGTDQRGRTRGDGPEGTDQRGRTRGDGPEGTDQGGRVHM